jgi:3-hydroxybutyryl-CoA dehydrogenase
MKIGIIGSGAMGSGIAQVAAQNNLEVVLIDSRQDALDKSKSQLKDTLAKLMEKGRLSADDAEGIQKRISYLTDIESLSGCDLIIEAIVENLEIKRKLFQELETVTGEQCILASNTSSLSITAIAASCKTPNRVIGIHFFNPAPLMPLVEIIPALQTGEACVIKCKKLIAGWNKVPVICKDSPGFIVNRVARPYYSESLRIYDEGIADFATIDQTMRDCGFRMGPFELMDMIGNDVNYAVTESVFNAFYNDPRYKPSITQKKLTEAGWLGKKSGRGYYHYGENPEMPKPSEDVALKKMIGDRVIAMLINEAYDALYLGVASAEDLDTAMMKGVNYPKGLISWGREIGLENVARTMETLYAFYQEDRYRLSPGLRKSMMK